MLPSLVTNDRRERSGMLSALPGAATPPTIAHLAHRAGGAGAIARIDGLHRVDDDEHRLHGLDVLDDRLHDDLGEHHGVARC